MSDINKDTFSKPAPSPIFLGMPEYLKDPKNFEKIQKTVIETLAGKHSHGEVIEWAKCIACQKRFHERRELLKKLGFRGPQQYMAWVKVHTQIKERMPLMDWSKKEIIKPK